MTFKKLQNLESDLTEEQYLSAEKFLSEASFLIKKQVKRYQWDISISHLTEEYNIFLHVTPSYIKKTSCTCHRVIEDKICVHVAAGLLFLRGYMIEQKSKKATSKPKAFNTKTILETISHRQLQQFVATYASTDVKFGTALKVHFARQVPSDDLEVKYAEILHKILRPIAGKKFYTIPAINYFVKNASELLEQARDAFALENFVEAGIILHAVLDKAMHASTRTKKESEKLKLFIVELHEEITLFLKSSIAPKLRQSFCQKLLEIYEKPSHPLHYSPGIIVDLFLKLGSKSEIKLAVEAMKRRLELSRDDSERTLLFFQMLLAAEASNSSIKLIAKRVRIQHLQGLFRLLLQANKLELTKDLLNHIRLYDYLSDYKFEDVEIVIGRRLQDLVFLAESLSRKYIRTKEPDVLRELLEIPNPLSGEALRSAYQSLLINERLSAQDLAILDKLEDYDLLIDHIMTNSWYEVVPKYIPKIAEYHSELIRFFTQKYMDACLLDSDLAKRNQIYMMQGLRSIYDDKLASEQIKQMEDFHQQLEEIWQPEI